MSDLNQWRLKMHTPKSWIPPIVEADEKPYFNENIFASSSITSISTASHKRKPRPKLKSYFGGHSHQSTEPEHFLLDRRPAISAAAGTSTSTVSAISEISKDTISTAEIVPDVELSITALMSRLLSGSGKGLSLQDNSLVLRIVESHRDLTDRVAALEEDLAIESEKTRSAEEELHQLETIRTADEKDFRAEVKRLEMVIAEGKRGMSDLLKARQGSIIRRSRYLRDDSSDDRISRDGNIERSQASMGGDKKSIQDRDEGPLRSVRLVPQSPSREMASLSRQFSASDVQQEDSLRMHSQGYETFIEPKHHSDFLSKEAVAQHAVELEFSSASSCEDPLQDEFQRTPTGGKSLERNESNIIWQMADILATRQGVPTIDVIPTLMQLFPHQPSRLLNASEDMVVSSSKASISLGTAACGKSETAITSPISNTDTDVGSCNFFEYEQVSPKTNERRFSFCPNDDEAVKLRESWYKRKAGIERFGEERTMSSPSRLALASPKIKLSKPFTECSPRGASPKPPYARSAGKQNRRNSYGSASDEITGTMALVTAPYKDISSGSISGPSLHDMGAGRTEETITLNDLCDATHPFARFPSSGSQRSTVTAIWQDTGISSGDNCDGGNRRHHNCSHFRYDSTRSSSSRGSRTSRQSLTAASLAAAAVEQQNFAENKNV